jgi:allantoinase
MENSRYVYSPIITRKPFRLPRQAKVAVWVAVNIEYYEMGSPTFGREGGAAIVPDVPNYSRRDYGLRVGIWRLMEVLDKHNIKVTASLNSALCEHCPIIIEEGKKRGWEFVGHGVTNSMLLAGLSEAEERQVIASSLDAIAKAIGQRPKGWRSPGMTETFNTPDILAEEGIRYISDWYNDDQPYPMKVKSGSLISLPASSDNSDLRTLDVLHLTPAQFYEVIKDHFDTLYREGVNQPRVMGISLHPFVIGTPSRIGCLDKALQYIKRHKDVWFATGWEIVSWYYDNYMNMEETQR